jgi:hypothetical protein
MRRCRRPPIFRHLPRGLETLEGADRDEPITTSGRIIWPEQATVSGHSFFNQDITRLQPSLPMVRSLWHEHLSIVL